MSITESDLESHRWTTRDGWSTLAWKVTQLIKRGRSLLQLNAQANENLGAVQARCTELLLSRRALAGEVRELLDAIRDMTWVIDSDEAPRMIASRPPMRFRVAIRMIRDALERVR